MLQRLCDRCKSEIKSYTLLKRVYRGNKDNNIGNEHDIELCFECKNLFEEWLKNKSKRNTNEKDSCT